MSDVLLKVSSITAGYMRGLPVLHEVSIDVARGQIVTILGPNGAGKSTLIKAIANLILLHSGEIHLAGVATHTYRPDQLGKLGIAYVPQLDNVFRSLSVQQNLRLAARRVTTDRLDAMERMFALFPVLAEFTDLRAGALSGGQRQMLAIAMAMIANPELILLDEPSAGLSPKVASEVFSLIQQMAATGVAVVLVEQNVKAALAVSDYAYVLAEGRNQLDGSAQAVMDDPLLGQIFLGAYRRSVA